MAEFNHITILPGLCLLPETKSKEKTVIKCKQQFPRGVNQEENNKRKSFPQLLIKEMKITVVF